MNENLFAAPEQDEVQAAERVPMEDELASRWARLGGALLDTLFVGGSSFAICYALGLYDPLFQDEHVESRGTKQICHEKTYRSAADDEHLSLAGGRESTGIWRW